MSLKLVFVHNIPYIHVMVCNRPTVTQENIYPKMFSPSYTQQKTDQTGTDSPWKWHPYGHLYTSFLYIKLRVNLGKCTFSVAVHGIILKVSGLVILTCVLIGKRLID